MPINIQRLIDYPALVGVAVFARLGTNMAKSKSNSKVRPGSSLLLQNDWAGICCAADKLPAFESTGAARKKVGLGADLALVLAVSDEDLPTVSLRRSRASLHSGVAR